MKKSIYIATNVHGRGVKAVTQFAGKKELVEYASVMLAYTNEGVYASDTVNDICYKLTDVGMGRGARTHARVSRVVALALVKSEGVRDDTFLRPGYYECF